MFFVGYWKGRDGVCDTGFRFLAIEAVASTGDPSCLGCLFFSSKFGPIGR